MSLDVAALRAKLDQLETEIAEANAAKSDLDSKTAAASQANQAMQSAITEYTVQNQERLDKMNEIIRDLQTAVSEG